MSDTPKYVIFKPVLGSHQCLILKQSQPNSRKYTVYAEVTGEDRALTIVQALEKD